MIKTARRLSPGWILAGVLLLAVWPGCRKKETSPLRLDERLQNENVALSPLREFDKVLPQQTLTYPGSDLREVAVGPKKYWGLVTEHPLTEPSDLEEPAGAELLVDKEKIAFSPLPLKDAWSWRWIKGEKKIDLRPEEEQRAAAKKIDLESGMNVAANGVFPPGPALLELSAQSGDPASSRPRLEIEVNGEISKDIVLDENRIHRWTGMMRPGTNAIRLAYAQTGTPAPRRKAGSRETARIHYLKIRTAGDMILISAPPGQSPAGKTFVFRYAAAPARSIEPVKKAIGPGQEWAFDSKNEVPAERSVEVIVHAAAAAGSLEFRMNGGAAEVRPIIRAGYSSYIFPTGEKAGRLRLSLSGRPPEKGSVPSLFVDAVILSDPLAEEFGELAALIDQNEIDDGVQTRERSSIPRKLKIWGAAYESLLAVPPTDLRFPVRVPEDGVLQFGYGVYSLDPEDTFKPVIFEILAKEGQDFRTLFRTSLSSFDSSLKRYNDVLFQEIDLSAEKGKAITLVFQTRASGGLRAEGLKTLSLRNGLAFWVSPVLRQKRPRQTAPDRDFNVILISVDTLRADRLGCYGYAKPTSPAMDKLARDGALFQANFSAAPYTLTSHATTLTGLDPASHHVIRYDEKLAPETPTLAETLRDRGFRTAAFTGGGQLNTSYGFAKGFEVYDERPGANELLNSAAAVYEKAAPWLEANRETRFFLFLHTYQPHNPYVSPAFPERALFEKKEFPWNAVYLQNLLGSGSPRLFRSVTPLERENVSALYDIEIRYTDEYFIKPLLAELKRLGLYDRTMIILTGDHGEEFQDHYCWDHGHTLYDELIRVPLIVKYPASRFRGRKVEGVTGLVDVAPTVLEEAGFRPARMKLDGRSLTALLEGKKRGERTRISYVPAEWSAHMPKRIAIVRAPYKLILNDPYPEPAFTFFTPPPPRQEPIELYDWVHDPQEKRNLAGRNPEIVRELVRIAGEYERKIAGSQGGRKFVMTKELEDKLRALGYIR